jgi:hypothetical protein
VVFDSQTEEMFEPSTSPAQGRARGAFDFEEIIGPAVAAASS